MTGMETSLRDVTLDDKYSLDTGHAYMTGVQALVRLPLLQRARDRAAGLNTAGFISGYRGSPLGTYDDALGKASRFLEQANVRFHPGLNEDIAATSVWGTQQVALLPDATVEGVFGIWYGKGPGVDRSADVLKHANAAGTSLFGGVVAIMGDDHGCQSSTLPHQSEQIMAAAMIPVLNPSTVQECLDFGVIGFALSRFSGCWVGLKEAAELGLGLYKVAMPWPLEPAGIGAFAAGLQDILVVEEKRGLVEDQLAHILYNLAERPSLVGKRDESGAMLLPSAGEIDSIMVAAAIVGRLVRIHGPLPQLQARLAALQARQGLERPHSRLVRTAFFCSGCPHNTSTNVPEGSRAMAGIGCHGMAYSIPERRTALITQMGGEGATWIGQSPFTTEKHVFQNLGDGTYFHSGLLAIRAAAAARINITYKILFNDAVAMTGGQSHDGELNVPAITRQVAAEGARRIVVITDEPEKYDDATTLAPGTTVHHRDDLDVVQRMMREVPGLSVLVYDQTCAAEKRRRRKRGIYPDPPKRVFINHLVCEGCGDCSVKSNCISVKPIETPLGRKRQIDQSDCNKDFSCLKGFCPSFVTVHGGKPRRQSNAAAGQPFPDLPEPVLPPLTGPFNILVTGIGGTGVVTIGALLGMAAHLEGRGSSVLDFTGLAQKNGGVTSHVRIADTQAELNAVRIGVGAVDLLLACDLIVAVSDGALSRLDPVRSAAVINTRVTPTSAFVRDTTIDLSSGLDSKTLAAAVRDNAAFVDATGLATALMGDSIASNLFMLGFAWQRGLVPLGFAALDRAIELNGTAIAANRNAFAWGRLAAIDAPRVAAAATVPPLDDPGVETDLPGLVAARAADLVAYKDDSYAVRYRDLVETAEAAERRVMGAAGDFTDAVARYFFKLMAYKDEYEVARLYSDQRFTAQIAAQFEGDFKLEFNLAPPLFAKRDAATGELLKRAYGGWMMLGFKLLARMKRLRGTRLDIFGYQQERRIERGLIDSYEADIHRLATALDRDNHAVAVEIARLPDGICGYGHVKEASLKRTAETRDRLLAAQPPARSERSAA